MNIALTHLTSSLRAWGINLGFAQGTEKTKKTHVLQKSYPYNIGKNPKQQQVTAVVDGAVGRDLLIGRPGPRRERSRR